MPGWLDKRDCRKESKTIIKDNRSVRKNQSAEKRKQRLSKQLEYNRSVRQNESAESRENKKSQQHVYYAARRDNTAAKTITTLITHFHTAVASGPLYVHVVNNYVHVVNNS